LALPGVATLCHSRSLVCCLRLFALLAFVFAYVLVSAVLACCLLMVSGHNLSYTSSLELMPVCPDYIPIPIR
jgi:hypothetical protein